jgi:hypothetical protein
MTSKKKSKELFKLDMTFEEAVKLALNTPPFKKKDKKNAILPKITPQKIKIMSPQPKKTIRIAKETFEDLKFNPFAEAYYEELAELIKEGFELHIHSFEDFPMAAIKTKEEFDNLKKMYSL